jgi:hypothetical protein
MIPWEDAVEIASTVEEHRNQSLLGTMRENETCPVCGDESIAVLEPGESRDTPPQIDDSWTICVSESGTYVHAPHAINNWTAEKIRRGIERPNR